MKSLLTRGPIGSCLLFSYCLLLICFQRVLAVAETVQINDADLRSANWTDPEQGGKITH